jgi:enoyl-CoA hydratase
MQFHAWLVGMRRGMEMVLTGDPISGIEAVERGWATRAYPADELEAKTLEQACRIAALPPDIVALNKRAVDKPNRSSCSSCVVVLLMLTPGT